MEERHLQKYGAPATSAVSGLEAKNRTEEGEGRERAGVSLTLILFTATRILFEGADDDGTACTHARMNE